MDFDAENALHFLEIKVKAFYLCGGSGVALGENQIKSHSINSKIYLQFLSSGKRLL